MKGCFYNLINSIRGLNKVIVRVKNNASSKFPELPRLPFPCHKGSILASRISVLDRHCFEVHMLNSVRIEADADEQASIVVLGDYALVELGDSNEGIYQLDKALDDECTVWQS